MNDNSLIDDYDQIVVIPPREVAQNTKSQEEYLKLIDTLESPADRLKTLIKSIFIPWHEQTHESYQVRSATLLGGLSGLLVGGILKSRDLHQAYQRKHNAAVFESKFVASRHLLDTLIVGCTGRGFKMGFQVGSLTGTASLIAFGSITYRNKLYYPDYLVGFATLGGLSRLWLGPRAVLVGCGIGACGSVIAYGLGRCAELLMSQSVTQMRLLHHSEWVQRREARLRIYQKQSEYNITERVREGDMR